MSYRDSYGKARAYRKALAAIALAGMILWIAGRQAVHLVSFGMEDGSTTAITSPTCAMCDQPPATRKPPGPATTTSVSAFSDRCRRKWAIREFDPALVEQRNEDFSQVGRKLSLWATKVCLGPSGVRFRT